jgi:diacylglycerol kinase (ATP)
MAPQSKNNDGVFTVCAVDQVSKLGIFLLIPRFIQGTQAGHPAVRFLETKKLSARALQGAIAAHADGETLCTAGDALSVELLPAMLDVVCG